MTEREQQPTQVNGRDEAWHRGETIDYDATSGSIIRDGQRETKPQAVQRTG